MAAVELGEEVQHNSTMAKRIAGTIKQQIVGLNYIQTAMDEIKGASYSNKQISKEVMDGSGTLNEAIAQLIEVVEQWQTPDFYAPGPNHPTASKQP